MESTELSLNSPQAIIHLVNANKTYALWGRATGKSNGGLGPRTIHLMNAMPRSQIGFVAPSYKMAFGQILNNVAGFWQNEMQLVEGENYVVGKKPPGEWIKPLIPVMDPKYVISFDNGSVMPVLSLEAEGTGNSFNLQALVGDEAKFFNEKKLKNEVIRAIRGCNAEFGHLAEFQSQWYFTDKYDGNIEWILDKRKKMDPALIRAVIRLQLEVNEMYAKPSRDEKKIASFEKILQNVRKDLVFVSEASAEENRVILGDKYFENQKADSSIIEYDVAILNNDPDVVENSFYPGLKDTHFYSTQVDIDPSKPLIMAADYQWRISPIGIAQYGILPGATAISLNFVYSCYELHPKGLIDAIDTFCYRFRNHPTKVIYYLFDKTATNKNPTSKPYYETVIERLQSNGWAVAPENMGEPPLHTEKFKSITKHLDGAKDLIPIKINKIRNEHMIISIKRTPAINYNGKTAKDKSSEKNLSIPAVKSTHFSDVFDMILYGCLDLNLVPAISSHSMGMSFQ